MQKPGLPRHLAVILRQLLLTMIVMLTTSVGTIADPAIPDNQALAHLQRDYGTFAAQRLHRWQQLIIELRSQPVAIQLVRVNDFFNRLAFMNDRDLWGQEDYWATPTQLLVSNGGDCEDFSIAKYFTLREIGIPEDQLRLVYVKALELDQAHMILTYTTESGSETLVLDNLNASILPVSKRDDLLPVYSFNGEGLWLSRRIGYDEPVGRAARLSRWQEVIARVNSEQLLLASR